MDDIPEAEQLERIEWLKGLGFSLTVVSSGSKSVHGHLHLDEMASFADAFPVLKLLTALAGSDVAVVSKARRMRLSGALRPNSKRVRGGAANTEQKLLESATHCYDLAEVRRVLEAEATKRGWKVDHLETRWSEYREAKAHCLPDGNQRSVHGPCRRRWRSHGAITAATAEPMATSIHRLSGAEMRRTSAGRFGTPKNCF